MYFYLTGIDYRRAPIEVRDEIYRQRKAISDFWSVNDPHGSAVLMTCNRIEIYGAARYADNAFGHISRFAESFPNFAKYAYVKYGEAEVFRHALRLAVGLESQIKGEGQILEQLKRWRRDIPQGNINDLWARAISLVQKIRAASGLDGYNSNIAALVFEDIRKKLNSKKRYEVIVIGTGKIAELIARYKSPEARLIFVAHKNYIKALALAGESGGEALYLKDLPQLLSKADVLICATASPHCIIRTEHLGARTIGRGNPLHIYDLSIPRSVEPKIAQVEGVFLQNLDDLGDIFYRHNESVREEVELASGLIEDALGIYKDVVYEKYH